MGSLRYWNGDRSEDGVDLRGYLIVALRDKIRPLVTGHEVSRTGRFFGVAERGVDDDRGKAGVEQFLSLLLLPMAFGEVGKLARRKPPELRLINPQVIPGMTPQVKPKLPVG
jgi:hypothetical protein